MFNLYLYASYVVKNERLACIKHRKSLTAT